MKTATERGVLWYNRNNDMSEVLFMAMQGAKWVWTAGNDGTINAYADFAVDFEAESRAVARVCASTDYALYCNGVFVSAGAYASYPEKKYYDEIELPVRPGKNRLAIVGYCVNFPFSTSVKDSRGVLFEVESDRARVCSGEDTLCRVSREYKSGLVPHVTPQLGYTVCADLTAYDGWREQEGKLSGFAPARALENKSELAPRPVSRLTRGAPAFGRLHGQGLFRLGAGESLGDKIQKSYLAARRLGDFTQVISEDKTPYVFQPTGEKADGVYLLFDLGGERTGSFAAEFEFSAETEVDYCWGEHLDDLRVRTEISGRNFVGSYRAPKGRSLYVERFRRLGLRYLMVFVHAECFTLYGAGIEPAVYPVMKKPGKLSDPLHEKIREVGVHTLHCCMHEHYEDCPWREQSQYVMDSRNQMLAGYYCFENREFARASLLLMSDRIDENGQIPLMQPSEFPTYIPDFTLCYPAVVADYLEYTGDESVLPVLLPRLERIVAGFESRLDETGMIPRSHDENEWNFFEWTDGMANGCGYDARKFGKEYALPNQAFFVIALEGYLDCLARAGKRDEKRETLKASLIERADAAFWQEREGRYATYLTDGELTHGAEYTQVLAVYAGIARGERRERVLSLLTSSDNGLVGLSLSNYLYKYDVLLSEGGRFRDFVRAEIERIWGDMLYSGATTFYEVQEGADAFYYAGSLCHGWSALPVYIYGKYGLVK